MITDIYQLNQTYADLAKALMLGEKCATYCELTQKQSLQLRLLCEETIGMMAGILGHYHAEFYLSALDKNIEIHIKAYSDMDISEQERKQFIAASSSGENVSYRGFMGKVRKLLESSLFGGEDCLAAAGNLTFTGIGFDSYAVADEWSLQRYRKALEAAHTQKEPVWDELEMSIVASLADDVIVGVHSDVAELIIKKSFA